MAERAGNTHRLSELQRDQILKHCRYFDLEQTGSQSIPSFPLQPPVNHTSKHTDYYHPLHASRCLSFSVSLFSHFDCIALDQLASLPHCPPVSHPFESTPPRQLTGCRHTTHAMGREALTPNCSTARLPLDASVASFALMIHGLMISTIVPISSPNPSSYSSSAAQTVFISGARAI